MVSADDEGKVILADISSPKNKASHCWKHAFRLNEFSFLMEGLEPDPSLSGRLPRSRMFLSGLTITLKVASVHLVCCSYEIGLDAPGDE